MVIFLELKQTKNVVFLYFLYDLACLNFQSHLVLMLSLEFMMTQSQVSIFIETLYSSLTLFSRVVVIFEHHRDHLVDTLCKEPNYKAFVEVAVVSRLPSLIALKCQDHRKHVWCNLSLCWAKWALTFLAPVQGIHVIDLKVLIMSEKYFIILTACILCLKVQVLLSL